MALTLAGSNTFVLNQQLADFIGKFVNKYGDFALERLDGEGLELNRLLDAVQSVPFLAMKKMVVVRSLSANKAVAEQAGKVIDVAADSTELIFYEPGIDKRTSYYKLLKSSTTFKEFNALSEQELLRWAVDEAKRLGGTVTAGDANFLIQRVGPDQYLVHNELQKLITYDPHITRETIELLSELSPQSKIFDLIDAAFASRHSRALQLYDEQRAQKVEPQQILHMIGWQLHALALVSAAGSMPAEAIAAETRLNPYVVRKTQAIARRISRDKLKTLVHSALVIDVKAKSTALNLDEALKNFILEI